MSSLRSRARRLAFGDNHDNHSASESSSLRSNSTSSNRSSFSQSRTKNIFHHSSSISEPCSCGGTNKSSEKAVRIAPRRTNRVRKIHRSQPFELFVEALEQDGCVVVEDFVNPQIATQVQTAETVDLNDSYTHQKAEEEAPLDINSLIRDSLLTDSLFQTLSLHFLTLETISWKSKAINMSISKPRLFKSTTQDINNPETTTNASSFHRTDASLHKRHHATVRYDYQSRRDTTLGLLVPELDSLSASIPLRLIPGSHLWDDSKPDVSRGVKDIDLRGGDAIILLGSLYHAVGNHEDKMSLDDSQTRPDMSRSSSTSAGSIREKLLHDMWVCSGIYRAENEIIQDEDDEV